MTFTIGDTLKINTNTVVIVDILEDDDWRHSFIEIENVETGVKQLKNVTNIHSPFYVNPCDIEKL
jgi:hypothetical protein